MDCGGGRAKWLQRSGGWIYVWVTEAERCASEPFILHSLTGNSAEPRRVSAKGFVGTSNHIRLAKRGQHEGTASSLLVVVSLQASKAAHQWQTRSEWYSPWLYHWSLTGLLKRAVQCAALCAIPVILIVDHTWRLTMLRLSVNQTKG